LDFSNQFCLGHKRREAFSDGVSAIVMTMPLELKVPPIATLDALLPLYSTRFFYEFAEECILLFEHGNDLVVLVA
jgi:uncharacterized membrane protein